MPDRGRDLERELRELGSRLDYPRTPDLAGSARRRIEAEDVARSRRRPIWPPTLSPVWAVAAMIVVVLAVPILTPTIRGELSDLFAGSAANFGGEAAQSAGRAGNMGDASRAGSGDLAGKPRVQQESAMSGGAAPESATGGQTASPSSGDAGAESRFGAERITLREAKGRAGNEQWILLPTRRSYGRPADVYQVRGPYGDGFSFVYGSGSRFPAIGGSRVGVVLTEVPGTLEATYLQGSVEQAKTSRVNVNSARGYWQENARLDPLSSGDAASVKSGGPPANILFWNQNGLSLRLESNLDRKDAVRIAESIR